MFMDVREDEHAIGNRAGVKRRRPMYEICRLLAAPKVAKPRKPTNPAARVGAKVIVYQFGEHEGVIVSKHESPNCWNIEIAGAGVVWFSRHLFDVVA